MDARTFSLVRELAADGGLSLNIRGDCMAPLIEHSATTVVRRRRLYLPGDVVISRNRSNDLVAHRLLGYRLCAGHLALVTKGDHCAVHDSPVRFESVIGSIDGLTIPLSARLAALLDFARIVVRRVLS
jgi:hypothetical protein